MLWFEEGDFTSGSHSKYVCLRGKKETKRIRMPDAKEQPVCLTHWRNCFRTIHPWENMTLIILPRSVKPMVIC